MLHCFAPPLAHARATSRGRRRASDRRQVRVAIAAKCLRYAWRHTTTGLRTDQTVPELPKAKLGNSTRSSRRGGSAIRSRCRRWSTQRHALVGQRLNGLPDVQGVAPESVELPHDHGVAGAGLVHQGGQAGAVVTCPGHHVGERLRHARGLERRVLLVEGLRHGADAGVPDAPPPAGGRPLSLVTSLITAQRTGMRQPFSRQTLKTPRP